MDFGELKALEEKGSAVKIDLENFTAKEAIWTPQFYLVLLIVLVNISAVIMLLSVASNLTQAVTGATPAVAATIVGLIGVFNGGGRLVWTSLSDYLGRTLTYDVFFVIQILAFFLLPLITWVWPFAGVVFLIITCDGRGFTCLPAYFGRSIRY